MKTDIWIGLLMAASIGFGAEIRVGDPKTEWKRSQPDVTVYLPQEGGVNDGDNEHFLVFESPKGDHKEHSYAGGSDDSLGRNQATS